MIFVCTVLFLHPEGIDFCCVLVTLAAVLGEFLTGVFWSAHLLT